MRVSVYGRLSAGFQFGQIWKMLRHDFGGLLRIFGMSLIIGLIVGIIFAFALIVPFLILLALAGTTALGGSSGSLDGGAVAAVVTLGLISIILIFALSYVLSVAMMFSMAMVSRALGYWTRQFDVPNWRGQNDPLPFETQASPPPAQQ